MTAHLSLASARILVVEDEPHLAQGLSFNLEQEGAIVLCASDGDDALKIWKEFSPNLIVLDLMLPSISGLEVLEKIRFESERIPVLILSAKNQLNDKLSGFSLGADDYLTKPFHLEEFLCRIQRLLKQSRWYEHKDQTIPELTEELSYQFGDNTIHFENCWAKTSHGEFRLTEQELKLLKIFCSNPEKIISRKQLLIEGWGYHEDIETRTLDIFLARLRKYFEQNSKGPKHFISVRNQGIVFYPHPK
ncbi:MAG: response regulator transcription factor [Oligoflexia bacterium]|nr:response regulator transcription factor [Oligoflexia bacterium]MBF0364008.1 response regulator transcription factor [Oligoflexia bacterium]